MRARLVFAITSLLLAAMACGHTESNAPARPGPASGGADSSAGAGGGTPSDSGGGGQRVLPTNLCNAWFQPECDEGAACTCRDDPRPQCQTNLRCQRGEWTLTPGACTDEPEPTLCPLTPSAAKDMPCRPDGAVCRYPDALSCYCQQPYDLGALLCSPSDGPAGPVPLLWFCGDGGAECPVGIPDVGTPCEIEGVKCGNPCFGNYARQCTAGHWEQRHSMTECL